ncbi:MAG: DUF6314 family protein [Pseudomonadota bacterium]
MGFASEVAARFEGAWAVERHIHDFDSRWAGRFDGEGVFSPAEDALAYEETGVLRLGGLTALKATRRYTWCFPDPGRVDVYFEDGSFFHAFDPSQVEAEASHYCDPDLYEVRYIFEEPRHWRAEWRVEGPRKDYRLVTHYRR